MVRPYFRFVSPVVFAVSPDEAAGAYERVRPDLDAMPAEAVGRITANVTTAAATVFGALPVIEAMGEDIKGLPHIDHPLLGKLRDYALALYYVGVIVMHAGGGKAAINALMGEAMPLRARLLTSAETLAAYDLVDAQRVASIRAGAGQLDTANDLTALSQLFRSGGDALFSNVPVTRAEIDRAAELGLQLLAALGRRMVGTDGEGLPSRYEDDRARAFRLVVRSYDEGRRAVTFLRWREGDADLLVPSLFAAKRRRSPPKDEPGEGEPGEGGPGDGGSGEGEPGGGGEGGAATGTR
ncbi:MAG TPA: hypothetical protein VFS43_40165 [Polyangiaceae bacterium]|nr:hypothetical protein [Polyangiaceae bacterium]